MTENNFSLMMFSLATAHGFMFHNKWLPSRDGNNTLVNNIKKASQRGI